MVKVGIIGAGGIAQVAHIPGYQKNDEVKIIGEGESKLGISSQSMRKTSSSCFSRERRQFRRLRGVVEGSRQGCGQSGFIHSGHRNRRRDNH